MSHRHNHLVDPIRCLLESSPQPLSEYALIQSLQSQGWLEPAIMGDSVALYGVHFLVYNALFQLQEGLDGSQSLMISALSIDLIDHSEPLSCDSQSLIEAEVNQADINQADNIDLKSYYLDWSNLDQATESSVEQLLTSFWERFVSEDEYQQALSQLSLEDSATYADIKRQYKRLAMKHHPDRGGDISTFQSIQHAFSVIQRRYQ